MNEWIIAGILLLLFAVVVVIGSRAWQGAYLEKLPLLDGEEILFEEAGVSVRTYARLGRGKHLPNSILRLTNRRLILAQQVLFRRGSHFLHFVILLDEDAAGSIDHGAMGAFKQGFVTFRMRRSELTLVTEGSRAYLLIPGGTGGDTSIPKEIRVETRRLDELGMLLA